MASCPNLSGYNFAKKINQHIVIRRSLLAVGNNAFEHSQQLSGMDGQAGFFTRFALGALAQGFAKFQHTAGNGPLAQQGRLPALDQRDPPVRNDDCANADQRLLWIFTLHGCA